MLMPPRAIGETLTLAVGDRIRWNPKAVLGLGGEENIDIVTATWVFFFFFLGRTYNANSCAEEINQESEFDCAPRRTKEYKYRAERISMGNGGFF
jgi:hypothetical protein